MEHESPSHHNDIAKYGYSPKELHHLFGVEEYIARYISGELYADCLLTNQADYLKLVKQGCHNLGDARWMAKVAMDRIDRMCDDFLAQNNIEINTDIDTLLDDVQYNIMKIAIKKEIGD
jgi:hypothetical protein